MTEAICCTATSIAYPSRTPFGKVLSLGWYDGTTSGLVQCSQCSAAFKYDIVDWDSNQDRRILAFSPISSQEFDGIVELLSRSESPRWPFWNPRWEFDSQEKERITLEIDNHLSRAGNPEYVVASDGGLERVLGMKRLSGPARDRLPAEFDGLPVTDDLNYWKEYIGLQD